MANDLQYKNDYMEPFIYLRINIFIPNRKKKEILSFFKVCRKTDYLTQRGTIPAIIKFVYYLMEVGLLHREACLHIVLFLAIHDTENLQNKVFKI